MTRVKVCPYCHRRCRGRACPRHRDLVDLDYDRAVGDYHELELEQAGADEHAESPHPAREKERR